MGDMRRIRSIYNKISKRLPSTYSVPKLYIHPSTADLCRTLDFKPNEDVARNHYTSVLDSRGRRINKKKTEYIKPTEIAGCAWLQGNNRRSIHVASSLVASGTKEMVLVLLHEIGHFYYLDKEGDKGFDNENKADAFAYRWWRKLRKEGLI